ncbi:CcmD family protein [Flaviaesturariibacter terrae]
MKKAFFALLLTLACGFARAQGGTPEMADAFRSNGKIYVVFAVILTIFAGIILYLVRLDRKISKLERNPGL